MTMDLVAIRQRERSATVAAYVANATSRATQALAEDDPLRSQALLELALVDLVGAVEQARVRSVLALESQR